MCGYFLYASMSEAVSLCFYERSYFLGFFSLIAS